MPVAKPRASGLLRSIGRSQAVLDFDENLVSFFVETAEGLGIPKSLAAIYGICFASPEPLSFGDIEHRLDISAGSISQGLRLLRDVGALRAASRPGPPGRSRVDNRRDFYEPDIELRNLVAKFIEQRLQRQLATARGRLKAVAESIPAEHNGQARILRRRLKALQNWHDKAGALLPLAKTFLKLG